MKLLGVDWLTNASTRWEPNGFWSKRTGEYSFTMNRYCSRNQMGFNILGRSTPRWRNSSSRYAGRRCQRLFAYPPKKLDWEKLRLSDSFTLQGIIDYWEVWNEPSSNGFRCGRAIWRITPGR